MRAVRALSAGFPGLEIMVDLRASTFAAQEVEMAFEAGADIITVSIAASDKSCREAVGVAKTFGARAALDLSGAFNIATASRRGLEMGFDALFFRSEKNISKSYGQYEELARHAKLPLVLDGNAHFGDLARLTRLMPEAVLIGRRITDAENPATEASRYAELIHRRRSAA